VMEKQIMNIIIIEERDDEYCYQQAYNLFLLYGGKVFEDIFEFSIE
jgi:mRNA interferase RelE/StbE